MVQPSNMMTAEMNASWKQFLEHKVNSFIKWDLVRFFHDNPHTADTADHIAYVVGRDVRIVQVELDGLVRAHILESQVVAGQRKYQLSEHEDIRQIIHEFVAACHNREFRVKVINYVVRNMSSDPTYDL